MRSTPNRILKKTDLTKLKFVGPKTSGYLQAIGIRCIADLQTKNPQQMYDELCEQKMKKMDLCLLDVFCTIVHEVKTGEQLDWWHFSQIRLKGSKKFQRKASDSFS